MKLVSPQWGRPSRPAAALVAISLAAGVVVSAAQAQDANDLPSPLDPVEIASNGAAVEAALSAVGLDAAWRAATDLGEIPRSMDIYYTAENGQPVIDLLSTASTLESTEALHSEVITELRIVALERTEAVADERARVIDRNRADAHLRGVLALLRSVALDMFAGTGEADDVLLGTDGDALFDAQRTVELRGHTLEEFLERRLVGMAELSAAEDALAEAIADRQRLDTAHLRLHREANALARTRNELETEARALLPVAAEAFLEAGVAYASGLTPRSLESYINAELALTEAFPGCRISWRTIAAVGAVEGAHGTYNGREIDRDAVPDRPIVGLALNGVNTDNFGEVVAAIPDTDGGRWDRDSTFDRAVGPMQFIPETWVRWAHDGDGDGVFDPQDLDDAALAAGAYLCNYGSQRRWETWKNAVFGYNHSAAYVASVKSAHNRMRRVVLPEIDGGIELQPAAPWDAYIPMPIPEPEDPAAEDPATADPTAAEATG